MRFKYTKDTCTEDKVVLFCIFNDTNKSWSCFYDRKVLGKITSKVRAKPSRNYSLSLPECSRLLLLLLFHSIMHTRLDLLTRREFYGNFYHTCLCFYYACGNIRHTEYGNHFHTIDFHTVLWFVLYTIVNFTTQCGENRHTDIANFATLIHTKKLIHCAAIFTILYGNYYLPYGEFKLICIGTFSRRTWVNFTQQYGKNHQRCHQN